MVDNAVRVSLCAIAIIDFSRFSHPIDRATLFWVFLLRRSWMGRSTFRLKSGEIEVLRVCRQQCAFLRISVTVDRI
ncbi:hypothetical protein [Microcoleus sp. B4-D4]|uniref:hypothetical protein n=1 Tax=Microcoleus sp. B4-D4 TaxID=2818667 RepID=UPI002FD26424